MKPSRWPTTKQITALMAILLLLSPLAQAAQGPQQQAFPPQQEQSSPSNAEQSQGSNQTASQQSTKSTQSTNANPAAANRPGVAAPAVKDSGQQPATAQQSSSQNQPDAARPVGTAAAPFEKTVGVAASMPAGAAIAPAKQRRVRSFVIKIGIVVGACVAVGTVAALSHASPSQPH